MKNDLVCQLNFDQNMGCAGIVEKPHVFLGLFKNVQMQDAQKTESRGVYGNTSSGAVCSATQQMSVFQQPRGMFILPEYLVLSASKRHQSFRQEPSELKIPTA